MRYQGGKSRIAKRLAPFLTQALSGGGLCFVSLFCGSCAVESQVKGFDTMILNDLHPYLIALLRAVQSGYDLPESITEAQYQFVRANKDTDPALTGFVGFCCSFGGKWFASYARGNGRNFAAEGKRSLLKDMVRLQNATFICGDYRRVPIPPGAVVYADPPYSNTSGYSTGKFDSTAFWKAMRLLAETGRKVFISEQTAPEDFTCVWEAPLTRTLGRSGDKYFSVTEKLFTYIPKRFAKEIGKYGDPPPPVCIVKGKESCEPRMKRRNTNNAETGVTCGAVIPEGRQVCPSCERRKGENQKCYISTEKSSSLPAQTGEQQTGKR